MEAASRRSFDDLPRESVGGCQQCGEPVAANLSVSIRRRTGTQASPSVASMKWHYCEHHAVAAFEKISKAFPGGQTTRVRS
jgi:hypothetical protein